MDEVIACILKKTDNKITFKKIYADDLVILIKEKHIKTSLPLIKAIFTEFNLIFNDKKSQIMKIRGKELTEEN